MQMLKNMFGSEKKYYLELDENEATKPVQTAVKETKKAVNAVEKKATAVVESQPAEKVVKTAKKAADAVPAKVEAAKKSSNKTPAKAKPSPRSAGASSYEPPFWVAAMYNNGKANVNSNGTQAEQTFATDNLMPTVTKYRRSPGPSLNKFRDMARTAKTPRR